MKIRHIAATVFLLSMLLCSGEHSSAQTTTGAADQWMRRAGFIFEGTVVKMGGSTVPIVPVGKSTVVVHVEEVFRNAGVVTDIGGKDITVQLKEAGSVKEKERAVFFTNVSVYGKSIAVAELGHVAATRETTATLRAEVNRIVAQLPDEQLQQRIAQADLVVVATVASVRPAPQEEGRAPGSEHDPEWREASLRIESTEKGQAPGGILVIQFPNSKDIRWFQAPKFHEGQRGIFLLKRIESAELRVSAYTALDPLDFQSTEQLPRVKKLMR